MNSVTVFRNLLLAASLSAVFLLGCKSGGDSNVASSINPAVPAEGSATTQSVRDNFAVAKSEIEEIDGRTVGVTSGEIESGSGTIPRTWSVNNVREAFEAFSSGVDPAPSIGSQYLLDGSVSAATLADEGITTLVAHFDDEILWMLPFLAKSERAFQLAYPIHDQHIVVIEDMPTWFKLRYAFGAGYSSEADFLAVWANSTVRLDYIQREQISARVRQQVYSTPSQHIVTHNPWGEYGHVHHRLVYEEAKAACIEFGKSLWINSVYIPFDAGPIPGGQTGDEYQEGTLTDADYVYGRMIGAEIEALRQVFKDADAAYGGALPNTWTWYDAHPATDDGGLGYVDWKYYLVVDSGTEVLTANDDADIAAYEAALPYFGCPSQTCGSYYP